MLKTVNIDGVTGNLKMDKNNLIEHFFEGPITNRKQKLTLTVRDGLGNEKKQDYYFKR